MGASFSIKVDLGELLATGPALEATAFANLAGAVRAVVEAGEERWKMAALKAPLWEGERQAYAASIRATMTGPFSGEIVSDYKYAEDIESGRPAYDLKRMLDSSLKVRTSRKGRRYLIIPFRHNTPGNVALAPSMPQHVYAEAKGLEASAITGHYQRQSGTGAFDIKTRKPTTVRGRKYVWGGRLPEGMVPKLKPSHATDPHAGMVRFKEARGGSTYLTFRVMVEGSSGWIIPARPGLWLAKAVAESLQRTSDIDFPAAVQMDLAAAG